MLLVFAEGGNGGGSGFSNGVEGEQINDRQVQGRLFSTGR